MIPIITEYNGGGSWGWKDPLSIHYIDDVIKYLNNPFFVAVWRSPLAVAKGEARFLKEMGKDVTPEHFGALLQTIISHGIDVC